MDTVEITLPVSNKKVVIRNYTTRKDDDTAEAVMYAGVNAVGDGTDQKISFPLANVMASQRAYIPLLVLSIDGAADDIKTGIDNLRSEDYTALESAVNKIVDEHSPKASAVNAASQTSTIKK